jgi:hypothetical protein
MYRFRISRAAAATVKKLAREDRYPKVRTGFLTDAGPAPNTIWIDPTQPKAAAIRVLSVDTREGKITCIPCDMDAADTEEFLTTTPRWLKLVGEGKLMLVGMAFETSRTEFWGPPPWPN